MYHRAAGICADRPRISTGLRRSTAKPVAEVVDLAEPAYIDLLTDGTSCVISTAGGRCSVQKDRVSVSGLPEHRSEHHPLARKPTSRIGIGERLRSDSFIARQLGRRVHTVC
jgi:hypothetical protein